MSFALQVAVKNNIDVFYFSTLYPLHILFVEDGKMGELGGGGAVPSVPGLFGAILPPEILLTTLQAWGWSWEPDASGDLGQTGMWSLPSCARESFTPCFYCLSPGTLQPLPSATVAS